jgi:DNA end-binding protein Ku
MLVETLAGDFDPSEFEDDYAEAVETLVKTKVEGGEVTRTETSTKSAGEVVDLLAALQRSVAAAKKGRGEDIPEEADAEDEPAQPSTAKKAAAGKSAAKKSAAKKTAAKKTAAKKAPAKKTAAKKKAS